MGLNYHSLKMLAEWTQGQLRLGETATIGRLNNHFSPKHGELLMSEALGITIEDHIGKALRSNYCKDLLTVLGAKSVDSIDYSDYEGASIKADLNQPVGQELHQRFDMVIEGGSIEHVFDIRQSVENIMKITKVGGHIFFSQMCNNFAGHGFYQFSPEFFYRVFARENGFRIRYCGVHESYPFAPVFSCPDPEKVNQRVQARNSFVGLQIAVLAEKFEDKEPFRKKTLQSDYVKVWNGKEQKDTDARNHNRNETKIQRVIEALARRTLSLFGLKPRSMPGFNSVPVWILRNKKVCQFVFGRIHRVFAWAYLSVEQQPHIFKRNSTKLFY